MAINKVVLNDVVKLDLTADTVTADKLSEGITAHDAAGNPVTGTMVVTTPTLTVSTNAGASVTATKGSLSVSGTADSSGSCVLELPEFGEWTITVTWNEKTATKTISVSANNKVSIPLVATLTLSGSPHVIYGYILVGGKKYYSATTMELEKDTEVTLYVGYYGDEFSGSPRVLYDGETVFTGEGTYTFNIVDNTTVSFVKTSSSNKLYYTAEITTASYDTSAAVASIMLGEEIV